MGKSTDAINPPYYRCEGKEVWEQMIDIFGLEKFITYCEINAVKYQKRAGKKEGNSAEQDLQKANWYLNKAKELRCKK